MPQKFEFRVTGTVPDPEDRTRRWADFSQFLISAGDQVRGVLTKSWPLIPWSIEAVTPTSEPATVELKTGDGRFDPRKPVTVNGYRYIPAPASQQGKAPPRDTVAAGPKVIDKLEAGLDPKPPCDATARPGFFADGGQCGAGRKREGDEYVCTVRGCDLRWGVDEERPGCPASKGARNEK